MLFVNDFSFSATAGPTVLPMLPSSVVPRAKINVNGWQASLSVTPLAVEEPIPARLVWVSALFNSVFRCHLKECVRTSQTAQQTAEAAAGSAAAAAAAAPKQRTQITQTGNGTSGGAGTQQVAESTQASQSRETGWDGEERGQGAQPTAGT